jgi:hypothetical protein
LFTRPAIRNQSNDTQATKRTDRIFTKKLKAATIVASHAIDLTLSTSCFSENAFACWPK